jgi:hypothetical protein
VVGIGGGERVLGAVVAVELVVVVLVEVVDVVVVPLDFELGLGDPQLLANNARQPRAATVPNRAERLKSWGTGPL